MHKLGWAGPSCCNSTLSILIVTLDAKHGHQLAADIRNSSHWNRWYRVPAIHVATDIKTVAEHASRSPLSIEMVVLLLEPQLTHCLKWATDTLQYLQLELRIGKLLLVDISGTPPLESALQPNQLNNFRRQFQVRLLRSNIGNYLQRQNLSNRICLMMEQLMGLKTGIPDILCLMAT